MVAEMAVDQVSIHAPARGATQRSRHGDQYAPVSIHAPARGATYLSWMASIRRICFNSRTREGCDCTACVTTNIIISFNSRTREGCDLCPVGRGECGECFNSRTREGCDSPTFYPYRVG